MTHMNPFLTIDNDTGLTLPRLLLRLLQTAVAPSMRAFMWIPISAPAGTPQRAAERFLHLYCYSDQSGVELTIGEYRLCFGVEPKRTARWRA